MHDTDMAYRRKKADVAVQREWKVFFHKHLSLISKVGIPEVIMQTRENWVDFLMHGRFHGDASYFHSWALPPEKVEVFLDLLVAYFNEGRPYFDVTALGHKSYHEELERRLGR